MKEIDLVYINAINDVCGVDFQTKEEVDNFYREIHEVLTLEEIERLQVKIEMYLHNTCDLSSIVLEDYRILI